MKENSNAIARMLRKDTILLIAFMVVAVGISCFVLLQTVAIVEGSIVKTLLTAVFIITMLILGGSMAWVINHLHKNKDEVYGEDLYYQDLIRKQKEVK